MGLCCSKENLSNELLKEAEAEVIKLSNLPKD